MPGGNRTGPMGMGPRTGRGAGYCSGSAVPGFVTAPRGGRMRGRGRGGGGGWRNMFFATGLTGWQRSAAAQPGPATAGGMVEDELASLRTQLNQAAATLEQVRERIDELTAANPEPPAAEE